MLFLSFYHQVPASKTVPSQMERTNKFSIQRQVKSIKAKNSFPHPKMAQQKKEERKKKRKIYVKYVYYKNVQKYFLILLNHIIFEVLFKQGTSEGEGRKKFYKILNHILSKLTKMAFYFSCLLISGLLI
ncbi:hypothetical protein PanWU01x14_179070 [Parasponia andersonii]|uniref:Uncharacterized protein n=1 Tax=Parasponia andersonii TaxID=3476 RepID=A0A2P5C6M7_PARAD|nr:hypothetical protein PanWU01x14_179070 [Parasponia andersonii]